MNCRKWGNGVVANIIIFIVSLIGSTIQVHAQITPGTDIWLADINDGFALTNHRNLTNREGYDNQPFFLPNGDMLFTRELTTKNQPQTDIFHAALSAHALSAITNTQESEYSPTLTPDKNRISLIRVNNEGKQHLWRYSFPYDKHASVSLLPDIEPVGYHAWINEHAVLLFVLGEPHTLQRANLLTKESEILDRDIGPSLYRIPEELRMSYTRRVRNTSSVNQSEDSETWQLMALNIKNNQIEPLTELPKGAYYYAWTPDQKVLAAAGSTIWMWNLKVPSQPWSAQASLSKHCPAGITRLAVNASMTTLAYVCNRT
ncbi:hypothetical protein OE749_01505 [Aestuariibacter sp. AA17]|uniref:Uncharacterized protein n=1 Tax=Fluctibacter corallii TaxID=2984329 RepID=A0ABT3A531_9ALTE|nr:hypothetical protein [Aestuariibacter sp. AA17]MCV2883372.1 hypothetical protein [Aestuariibacter sp. AA17]